MHRDLQFGMRENSASDRRHGSRFSEGFRSNSNCIARDTTQTSTQASRVEPLTSDTNFSDHAARQSAATGGRKSNESRLLTVSEVAELLHVTVSWVYGRTRKRSHERLPGYRLGKYWRFREDEIHAWVKRQCAEPRNA